MNENNQSLWQRCEEIIAELRKAVVVLESAARSLKEAAGKIEQNNLRIRELNICLKEARDAFKRAEEFFKPIIEAVEPLEEDYLTETKQELLNRTHAAAIRASECVRKLSAAYGNPTLMKEYIKEAKVANEEFRDLLLKIKSALPAQAEKWDENLAEVNTTIRELDEINAFINPQLPLMLESPITEDSDKNQFN